MALTNEEEVGDVEGRRSVLLLNFDMCGILIPLLGIHGLKKFVVFPSDARLQIKSRHSRRGTGRVRNASLSVLLHRNFYLFHDHACPGGILNLLLSWV